MVFFSIIIPVYNAEKYIKRCLNSIVSQSYRDYELLIVDDGSSDCSSVICDEYAKQYNSIEVEHIPNGGVSHARNIGLSKANGKYIIFVDADDELSPNALKILAGTIINESEPDFLMFDNCVRNGDTIIYPHSKVSIDKRYNLNRLFDGYRQALIGTSFPAPWGKVYKMNIIRAHNMRFDEKLKRNEDEVFNCKFLLLVNNIILMKDVLYIYYMTPQSAVSRFYGQDIEYMINTVANANKEMMLRLLCEDEEKAYLYYRIKVAQLMNLHICSLYANKVKNKVDWLEYIINIGKNILQDNLYNSLMQVGKFRAKIIAAFYKHIYVLHFLQSIMQLGYNLKQLISSSLSKIRSLCQR